MRFTILVFLTALVGLGRKEKPLWMRCIVLAVRAFWFLRESRNFHTDKVLTGYQRVEGVVVGLQGICCTGRASSRPLQGVPRLDREVWCQASCCTNGCSNPCFLEVSQERKLVLQELGGDGLKGRYMTSATGMKTRAASFFTLIRKAPFSKAGVGPLELEE